MRESAYLPGRGIAYRRDDPLTADIFYRGDKPVMTQPASATSALPSYIEEIERAAIQHALQENRYNKTRTAAALGITFRALRYKLKKLGID